MKHGYKKAKSRKASLTDTPVDEERRASLKVELENWRQKAAKLEAENLAARSRVEALEAAFIKQDKTLDILEAAALERNKNVEDLEAAEVELKRALEDLEAAAVEQKKAVEVLEVAAVEQKKAVEAEKEKCKRLTAELKGQTILTSREQLKVARLEQGCFTIAKPFASPHCTYVVTSNPCCGSKYIEFGS